jgi:hypothetical protein
MNLEPPVPRKAPVTPGVSVKEAISVPFGAIKPIESGGRGEETGLVHHMIPFPVRKSGKAENP